MIAQALRDANLPGAKIVDGGIAAALKQTELMPRFLLVDVSTSATPVQDVAALAAVMEPGTKLDRASAPPTTSRSTATCWASARPTTSSSRSTRISCMRR